MKGKMNFEFMDKTGVVFNKKEDLLYMSSAFIINYQKKERRALVVNMKDTVYDNGISDKLEPISEDSILIPIKGKGITIKQLPLYVLCNYETETATVQGWMK